MVGVLVIDMRKLSYPPIWLLFEQGRVQVAAGALFAVGVGGCCGLACGQDPAMSDARPHRRLRLPRLRPWSRPCDFRMVLQETGAISPWVLDFCAVSGGSCSLSAPPTWGNAGVLRRFGLIRPAKPLRSLQMGLACVEDGASWRVLQFRRCWAQALRLLSLQLFIVKLLDY